MGKNRDMRWTSETRRWAAARVLMVWQIVGARLAWHKAEMGGSVKWIGATYRAIPGGIEVTIDDERLDKLQSRVRQAKEKQGLVTNMSSLAGELSWG